MKRWNIMLLILAIVGAGRLSGQGIQVTPGDTFTYSETFSNINSSHEINGYINNTANADSIYWRLVSLNIDSAWQMSFCDPLECYYFSPTIVSYSSHRFWAPHDSIQTLTFGATPYCTPDSSSYQIVAWLANDSAATSVTIYFVADYTGSCATAINNIGASNLRIYPSPVDANLTVAGLNGLKNVKLSVYDVLGRPVIQTNLVQPAGQVNVNTEQLNAGIYIVTIQSEGTTLLTKRIEKTEQ